MYIFQKKMETKCNLSLLPKLTRIISQNDLIKYFKRTFTPFCTSQLVLLFVATEKTQRGKKENEKLVLTLLTMKHSPL